MQLGPGVCLARVPVNGRNFEYLSGEDPFLGAVAVQPVVKGIQSKNVIANVKHVGDGGRRSRRQTPQPCNAVHSTSTTTRRPTAALSRPTSMSAPSGRWCVIFLSTVIAVPWTPSPHPASTQYLPVYEAAVDAGVGSFMCSYNKINNSWSCEDNVTLGTYLKGMLLKGKRAWVMSDWGATHSTSINEGECL